MAARGHDVTVYGRSHYISSSLKRHRDVRLVVLPTLEWKYTDTIIHTLLSMLHALFQSYDIVLICNAANSIYAWMPRMLGIPVVVNVDGIERQRRKWNRLGRTYYRICERLSTWFPNAIVADAQVIRRYYQEEYGATSVFIPYGAVTEKPGSLDSLATLGLAPAQYFLYVSRFEPENNAHLVVSAFEKVHTTKLLAVVGDAPYARDYIRRLKSTRDTRIRFPGALYGPVYRQLQAGAFCYVHATEVGGTHPALIEAMGQGNLVIANGTPENAEVLGDAGLLYRRNDVEDLARCLQEVADFPERFAGLRHAALERARSAYSWSNVVSKYEELFLRLVSE